MEKSSLTELLIWFYRFVFMVECYNHPYSLTQPESTDHLHSYHMTRSFAELVAQLKQKSLKEDAVACQLFDTSLEIDACAVMKKYDAKMHWHIL